MTNPDDRARLDELIATADRVARRPLPPARPPWLPIVLLGGVGLVAVVLGVKLAGGGGGSSAPQSTAVPIAVTTLAPSTTQPVIITLPPTTPPSTVPTTTAAPSTTTAATTTVAPTTPGADVPVRSIRYEGGVLHMEGTVPDQATADRLVAIATAVVGAENVEHQYTIDPAAPLPASEPMYFPDRFKFAPNEAQLSADDIAVLDQIMVFLVQNPQVTLDILAYTDATGPDQSNLELSQLRANTIWAYLLYGGIAPERVTATGMGEADPIASNDTEEGRSQNRRVEFMVHDLLG